MPISLYAWFYLIFAVPQPVVNWNSTGHESLKIIAEGREELLDRCLEGGIEVRYRFQMRYCVKGTYWFDNCQDEWDEIKTLKYDPVKETYFVKSDRIGDEEPPFSGTFSSKTDALQKLSTVEEVNLEKIARGKYVKDGEKNYLGIRVVSDCKGSVGSTMLDISYYLTFGLVKVSRFDSGWVAFYL